MFTPKKMLQRFEFFDRIEEMRKDKLGHSGNMLT